MTDFSADLDQNGPPVIFTIDRSTAPFSIAQIQKRPSGLDQRNRPRPRPQCNPPRIFRDRTSRHVILQQKNVAIVFNVRTSIPKPQNTHHSPSGSCDDTTDTTWSSKRGEGSIGLFASSGHRDGWVVNAATDRSSLKLGLRTHTPRSPLVPNANADIWILNGQESFGREFRLQEMGDIETERCPLNQGVFALPYASTHNARPDVIQVHHQHIAGPNDTKRDKKRKEISGKLGKELSDRRDEGRHFAENISALLSSAIQLASRPETHPMYNIRMYPLSLERSALLAQLAYEEKHGLAAIETAYEEERGRVEEEWRKGRVRVRERLLEGIEERRRRAREEKEGEGAVNGPSSRFPPPRFLSPTLYPDVSLDSQTRSHITRKLRNKLGTSPPPTPLGAGSFGPGNGSTTPITSGPLTNPHSLSVDEIPSPFPFPLTSVTLPNGHVTSGAGSGPNNGNRRRNKGTGTHQGMVGVGGLGKSLAFLGPSKDTEIEADLIEIRRGTKRRRAAAVSSTKVS
ncbi:hypothetical protein J3R83DRAFT_8060 [Lanmaoa asiatica]|nr:hypothetical protein J3R83DRAFT_8060 [Lanmaoa asiatica]